MKRIDRMLIVVLALAVVIHWRWPGTPASGSPAWVSAQGPDPEALLAAQGTAFTYQGELHDNGALASGTYDFEIKLYDALAGGGQVGATVTREDVAVVNGIFTVELDFGAVFGGDARFLQIGVRAGASTGAFTALVPRQALNAAPYALGLRLPYSGTSSTTNPVIGATGTGINGTGLLGVADNGPLGYGVWGRSATGYGVVGDSNGGSGVLGRTSGDGNGVMGRSSGVGVYGWHDSILGTTAGVLGETSSTASFASGVQGVVVPSNGNFGSAGVTGRNNTSGSLGYGVYGTHAGSGNGVYAHSASGTALFAVSGSGPAAQFNGNVAVTGSLSKGAGSFKIDHPLDPENQYLYHSFVESPDMMNVYNGNVILDSKGAAVVELPDWFEALNMEFRYQLTPIGAPGPNLYIAEKIKGNRFAIAGGQPGGEVSWQVTGIRHDPYANQNRIPVEEQKAPADRGKYLYPETYGKPDSQAIAPRGADAGPAYEPRSSQLATDAASPATQGVPRSPAAEPVKK